MVFPVVMYGCESWTIKKAATAAAKSLQLCPALFVTPWSVARQALLSMGFPQPRILEWAAISFSRGSSQPRDQITSPALADGFFTAEPPGNPPRNVY